MSRSQKALTAATFQYLQFGLSIVTGIVLVPFILASIPARQYGLWLASGEVLGYLASSDFGVFSILPWIVASADGKGDVALLRHYLAHAIAVAVFVALVIVAGYLVVWLIVGPLQLLDADVVAELSGPISVLVLLSAVTYPLRLFPVVLAGLQDVTAVGIVNVVQSAVQVVLTAILLYLGLGLYALAWALAIPPALGGLLGLARLAGVRADLLRGWSIPNWPGVRALFGEGFGAWLGVFGYRLLSASNSTCIALLGRPEWVPIFSCTSKIATILQQLGWVLPDSGLVGMAQLHGEGKRDRVRVLALLYVECHLLIAGGLCCIVFVANPAFVRWWVGSSFYGGHLLNSLILLGLFVGSLAHALVLPVGVLGYRVAIGLASIGSGLLFVLAAIQFGASLGLPGVALALPLSMAITLVPIGAALFHRKFGIGMVELFCRGIWPWLWRFAPLAIICAVVGSLLEPMPLFMWLAASLLVLVVIFIVIQDRMSLLLAQIPLPERFRSTLIAAGIIVPYREAGRDG